MGVAVESGLQVAHGDVAESVPTHQSVGKLKRTVLHHLGIKAAVCPEVDVFEEDTVHRGLYHRSGFRVDGELMLRVDAYCGQCRQ